MRNINCKKAQPENGNTEQVAVYFISDIQGNGYNCRCQYWCCVVYRLQRAVYIAYGVGIECREMNRIKKPGHIHHKAVRSKHKPLGKGKRIEGCNSASPVLGIYSHTAKEERCCKKQ